MKKKLVEINSVAYGSTGNIMLDIAKIAKKNSYDVWCFVGHKHGIKKIDGIYLERIGNKLTNLFCIILSKLGFDGYGAYFETKSLIKKIKDISPDIIHLHNIHGYFLNYSAFFNYLKKEYKGKVVWTLHDCWSFTGHCSYFTFAKCDKWKTKCKKCSQLNKYPSQYIDTTKQLYLKKKELFNNVNDMTIVTPSKWLGDLVKESFLTNNEVITINNGINLDIFKKYEKDELDNIYIKYGINKNKKILLGVASGWEKRKGLEDFISLSKEIEDKYQIIIVGTNEENDKILPSNIISIHRTENQVELAKLYNIANLYINPTYEDNFPTVNMESIACGTPVIAYDTGGCKEVINLNCGAIMLNNDISELKKCIERLIDFKYNKNNKCLEMAKKYNKNDKFMEYLKLFER